MTDRLELWYRRLICAYPADHRAVYAEDMVNVLMASAVPGQRRPRLSTGLDLLKGAAVSWARRGLSAGRAWPRAGDPAFVTLLALLALCTLSFTAAGVVLGRPTNSSYGRWGDLAMWAPDLVWFPTTVVAVLGWQRLAARLAWGGGVLLPAAGSLLMSGGWTPGYLGGVHSLAWFAVALIAAAGLASERPLRNGFRALSRSRAAPAGRCVAALAGGTLLLVAGLYAWTDGGAWYDDLTEQLDTLLPLVLLAVAVVVARSTALADRAVRPR